MFCFQSSKKQIDENWIFDETPESEIFGATGSDQTFRSIILKFRNRILIRFRVFIGPSFLIEFWSSQGMAAVLQIDIMLRGRVMAILGGYIIEVFNGVPAGKITVTTWMHYPFNSCQLTPSAHAEAEACSDRISWQLLCGAKHSNGHKKYSALKKDRAL